MALTPGNRLGVYDISEPIGEGGMGQVWRATDTTLGRQVAIKILPDAFAADPQRLARFEREAKTLAALNHPHIAAIYAFERLSGIYALVMELVEGEDLSQRLARGAIALDDALPIATQILQALEAAHGQGIIHRDLKPSNIKVRVDGIVKVLDFGLAKAVEPSRGPSAEAMNSPTITTPAMTQAGMILGTAAYMSPEQARGNVVDKRSDLWAFGAVLFETLTGTRAFRGDNVTDTIAAVIAKEPEWARLPVDTPVAIRRLLRRCLEKDRNRRLSDAADARLEIDDVLSPPSGTAGVEAAASPAHRLTWSWAVACGLGVALGAAIILLAWAPWRRVPPPSPLRLSAELGADVSMTLGFTDAVSLSPDGTVVAFVAQKGGGDRPQIYVRRLTELRATPLPGTDDASSPFFSPNGEWIGFFAAGKLKKIAVSGGAVVTLCDAPTGRGGAWSEDDTIVFQPQPRNAPLMRVSSAGGTPEPLSSLGEGEVLQQWPQVLPGGQALLFTSVSAVGGLNNLVVQAPLTGARTVVHRGGYHGRYLPSGHLVYLNDGKLFAAPFDLNRLAVTGPAVPALEGVSSNTVTGAAQYAVSASGSGTIVYLTGPSSGIGGPIHWMDQKGTTIPLRATPANWMNLLFAPDGQRLAVQQINEGQSDIWVYEWERDIVTRLTFDLTSEQKPVWTHDGRRLVLTSNRADKPGSNLYWQRADGTGDAQRLTESRHFQQPASWHPSGRFLAFEEQDSVSNVDLMILPMAGDEVSGWKPGKPTVFLNTPFAEREPMFSPDGRWLAYSSNESGRDEVYVRPFPGPGGKWQVSTGGGVYPTWSRTRRELLYGVNGQMMVAPYVVEGDSFRSEKPRLWSNGRYLVRGPSRMFDLHPDGTRVALAPVEQTPGVKQDKLTFLFNFFDELHRIAPVTTR